ncbi:MAG: heavy metal-associated domain-containing protein [Caldimonas sp.]
MKTIHASLAAVALAAAVTPTLAVTTIKATVNGMYCEACAHNIEKRISKMSATQSVFVDLDHKVVAVQAKDGQTLDDKKITAEITNAGYKVVKLETLSQPLADIKASLKTKK